MAIPKVCGIETEYGITVFNQEDFNAVLTSTLLVNSYAEDELRRVRWDFDEETPGRDARGFVREGLGAPEVETHLVNVVLRNGARYYVDHAHPEYSTPECIDPFELIAHDRAGELVLERSVQSAERLLEVGQRILVYKNNSDGKGNSYGCHENYLVDRAVPFGKLVTHLLPHFVTRQVYCGSGKVGAEHGASGVAYQISQRADFFEEEVGLETTLKRPIINTRDEPHADPAKYRRLHVIVGDANMSEVATYLKVGTTALILQMIEDDALDEIGLQAPVPAMRQVSHDPTCRALLRLGDGSTATPVEVQWEYLDRARKYLEEGNGEAWAGPVVDRWESVLTALEDEPMRLEGQLDWVAKYRVLEAYRERHGLDWDSPKLALIDLQYHDVRADKGIAQRLMSQGKLERLVSPEQIRRAVEEPPLTTRAYFRGRCLKKFAGSILAANWDSLVFDLGTDPLQRVPMPEPTRGTNAHVGDLLDAADTVTELLDALAS